MKDIIIEIILENKMALVALIIAFMAFFAFDYCVTEVAETVKEQITTRNLVYQQYDY